MAGELEARIIELEVMLTYQARLLEELNEALIGANRELDALRLRVARLEARDTAGPGESGDLSPRT